jgi:hypothetical protein
MHGKTQASTTARACSRHAAGLQATRYHSLIVERETLPDCLEVTAETDGLIMGLQHKTLPCTACSSTRSIASEHGHRSCKNFLDLARAASADDTAPNHDLKPDRSSPRSPTARRSASRKRARPST